MEPERHIEKVLREMAKRRQDESGEPPELHPATRRLFQAEITRQYAKRQCGGERSFFARFGPAFAYAACFAALILGGILLVPLPSTPQKNSKQLASAPKTDAYKESSSMTTPVPTVSEAVSSDEIASATRRTPNEAVPRDQEVRSADLSKAKSNEEVKLADGSSLNRRIDISSGEVQTGLNLEPAAAPPVVETQIALADKAAVPPTSPPSGAARVAQEQQQAFFQRTTPGQDTGGKRRETNGISEQTPVLLAFTVQQEGSNLRFVDSDGSVYNGLIVLTNAAVSQNVPSGGFFEAGAISTGLVIFPFTVSGSNRTLQEWVVFNGSFSNRQNALPTYGAPRSETEIDSLGIAKLIPSLSSSNWTVTGTATVGVTNQIKVEAAPVTPAAKP